MWIADKYIDYVKEQTVEHPGESWEKMLWALRLTSSVPGFFLKRVFPKAPPEAGSHDDVLCARIPGKAGELCMGNIFALLS